MDRSKIKIVEFGDETSSDRPAHGRSRADQPNDSGIKIREFGFEEEPAEKKTATPENMGPVKVVEFDNAPLPRTPAQRHNAGSSAVDVPTPSQIKVFEYDDQGRLVEKPKTENRHNGIKIVEFD